MRRRTATQGAVRRRTLTHVDVRRRIRLRRRTCTCMRRRERVNATLLCIYCIFSLFPSSVRLCTFGTIDITLHYITLHRNYLKSPTVKNC